MNCTQSQLSQEERGIVFVWVPGHVGIRGNRREATALSLSLSYSGHSHVIILFLLKGEEAPFCVSCDDSLSLEHILLFDYLLFTSMYIR